jgi:hypothetical protein
MKQASTRFWKIGLLLLIKCGIAVRVYASEHSEVEIMTPPVHIRFGAPETTFIKAQDAQILGTIDMVERKLLPTQLLLDGTISNKHERVWCKRVSTNAYEDIFIEKQVSRQELLKINNIDDLKRILGEPIFVDGSFDLTGTVLYQWRVCNGQRGKKFEAIEVTADFQPIDHKLYFILTRIASESVNQ